jgi:hypothetical protein
MERAHVSVTMLLLASAVCLYYLYSGNEEDIASVCSSFDANYNWDTESEGPEEPAQEPEKRHEDTLN